MSTITEALAEIKTIQKRMEKKRQFVTQYLARADGARDPLEREGGSASRIAAERQAISDLESRIVELRQAIHIANDNTSITVCGQTKTISAWLIWRRDVAPIRRQWLGQLRSSIDQLRTQSQQRGARVLKYDEANEETKPQDILVNINEVELSREIEAVEEILGTLDGQLSLKNATVLI